jgi:hypothetical protein
VRDLAIKKILGTKRGRRKPPTNDEVHVSRNDLRRKMIIISAQVNATTGIGTCADCDRNFILQLTRVPPVEIYVIGTRNAAENDCAA